MYSTEELIIIVVVNYKSNFMYKKFMMFGAVLFLATQVNAQLVRETRIEINKQQQAAYDIEFPYDSKIVEGAWDEKAKSLGLKGKSSKGVTVYTASKILDIHFEVLDYYVSIIKVSKDKTSIAMTASKGYSNFITDADDKIVANIKQFLINFATNVEQYKLKQDITAQESVIKSAEKEKEKLINDGKKIEQDLQKNKEEQEKKIKEIDDLNGKLQNMRSNLK